MMQAIVNREYGPPDDLKLEEVERPTVGEDSVLVRVRAAPSIPTTGMCCEACRTSSA